MTPRRGLGILALALFLAMPFVADGDELSTAAVVVRLGPDQAETRCVNFAEPSISGEELLRRSGLDAVLSTGALGQAVCSVDGTGCPAEDCFCQCRGAECTYWSYWHLEDGAWGYATVGAAAHRVGDGDVDGWSWGPGSVTEAIEPPIVDLKAACGETGEVATVAARPAESPAGNAASYIIFGALVLGLGSLLLWQRRRVS